MLGGIPDVPTRSKNTVPKHANHAAASSTKISACQTQPCDCASARENDVFGADSGTSRRRSKEYVAFIATVDRSSARRFRVGTGP